MDRYSLQNAAFFFFKEEKAHYPTLYLLSSSEPPPMSKTPYLRQISSPILPLNILATHKL